MNNKKSNNILYPDYLFETSWEVCNMVGGIYTVLSTKAKLNTEKYGDNYLVVGPDVWKETSQNPYFEEDPNLYRNWVALARKDGLNLRVGRWRIEGRPVAILVDFTQYFPSKNDIFKSFWDAFKLDSLQGDWNYIEPAMFGYAAGKVIEHFYDFHVTARDHIAAHFHEWMTGTGLLYLKQNTPQIGTVFTTHATLLGRTLAGNHFPLYSQMEQVNPEEMSQRTGIRSQASLERTTAREADVLTTVSEITARECSALLGREVDLITPNGFDDAYATKDFDATETRENARNVLGIVAQAVVGKKPAKDALLLATSGRYEFLNKGIDIYLDALSKLKNAQPEKEIWGFVLVPSGHSGPRKEILQAVQNQMAREGDPLFVTHQLNHYDNDPVVRFIREKQFNNGPDEMVNLVFIPAYLNGQDELIKEKYYDLLPGFDLTVFPSYYEPWGYTPLESIVHQVPTVTTSLTGFGQWVKDSYPDNAESVRVISRNEENREEVVQEVVKYVLELASMDDMERLQLRENAREVSRIALWSQLIDNYYKAVSMALRQAESRFEQFVDKQLPGANLTLTPKEVNPPLWNKILIEPQLPENLEKLRILTRNIWWTWDNEAKRLFSMICDNLWKKYNYNPIHLLEGLTYEQLNALSENKTFIEKLHQVYDRFMAYMDDKKNQDPRALAYFSMEYGLHDTIKTYSGGLGMLAGDYLKEASDSNINMVAVGLLYRYGYFVQRINRHGEQQAEYIPQKFTRLPLIPVRNENDEWITINLALPGRNLKAKIWRLDVGRIPLYLLDTDIEENSENDRFITHQLYGGDLENRFKQEFLLGVGGIRVLNQLNLHPEVYHINEGHAAFISLERLRMLIHNEHLGFYQAMEVVRASSLFTTHTPVPAGHDTFPEDLLRMYMPHYAERLNISWETFMGLGRSNPANHDENFSMSILALNLSQEINGVSKLHGEVSRDMFKHLFQGYIAEEVPIGFVTNGVHFGNWTSGSWRELYDQYFGENWRDEMENPEHWQKIYDVEEAKIWNIRNHQRTKLVQYLKERVSHDMLNRQESPRMIRKVNTEFSADTLTFGFARRFATYKRAHLLFKNLERLAALVNNQEHPVQFVFAGKAHPNDGAGQGLLKYIIEIIRKPEFAGKILFVEDYDITLGRKLVQGVDVWLNTPTRPLEASGTSGEKAVMNGVLNCSVLDGWWAEGYVEGAGWALPQEKTYSNQDVQDELDAETLYDIIEEEIVPAFYSRNEEGVPDKWVKMIKTNIAEIAPHFTTRRMLQDYFDRFYNKLFEQNHKMVADNYREARELAKWKRKMWNTWDDITVLDYVLPNPYDRPMKLGDNFHAEVVLNLPGIKPEDIGMEIVFGQKVKDRIDTFVSVETMKKAEENDGRIRFIVDIPATRVGVYDYAFRLFPTYPMLAYPQTFKLVKWL
jgi:phosphorylase/glycogen(starch) synthase